LWIDQSRIIQIRTLLEELFFPSAMKPFYLGVVFGCFGSGKIMRNEYLLSDLVKVL